MRKRMNSVYDLRGENRKNLIFEVFLHILLLVLLQVFEIQTADSIGLQLLLKLRVRLISLFIKRGDSLKDLIQLLFRRHA